MSRHCGIPHRALTVRDAPAPIDFTLARRPSIDAQYSGHWQVAGAVAPGSNPVVDYARRYRQRREAFDRTIASVSLCAIAAIGVWMVLSHG